MTSGRDRAELEPTLASDAIAAAAEALRGGEVVCVPTETTYGLAVDIRSRAGLERLLVLKGRDPKKAPIALMAADAAQARSLAAAWPARAEELACQYWPGPLTLVLPAKEGLAACLVGPTGGVGVRVPAHSWPRGLCSALGAPITATSANPHGEPAAISCAEARDYFGDRVALYLDAGLAHRGQASTLIAVDLEGRTTLIRQGVLAVPNVDSPAAD